ncbi:MAG: hypothetical protein ACRCRR_03945 [Rickettsia sp.]
MILFNIFAPNEFDSSTNVIVTNLVSTGDISIRSALDRTFNILFFLILI